MKIIHVETGRNLYGGALQVVYLIKGLRERGFLNTLVCTEGSGILSHTRGFTEKTYALHMSGELDLKFIFRLRDIIRKEDPDIVHLHSRRGAATLGGIASRLSGKRTVLSRRVDAPEIRAVARFKYMLYDRVITISMAIRDVLIRCGVPDEKIRCIHSAIEASYPHQCNKEWFRKEFGIPSGVNVIGVVAQLIDRKGHVHLIRAIPDILTAHPGTVFFFFGKGPLEMKLRRLCSSLRLNGSIIFAGFRDDIKKIYPCLDILVHPATLEGLGISLLEASASSVPIVASNAGGIPEIVRDGINGILTEPADPGAISRAVIRLLEDPELRTSMGMAGRSIVEKEFSIDRMVEGNIRVYRELA